MPEDQLRLFVQDNPLRTRFSDKFFHEIPTHSGIYWMENSRGDILYVGKAKNLRTRIRSYRTPDLARLPSKTSRLVKQTYAIHWELAPDETQALLRENELLRFFKPRFNILNTQPETYTFFAYRSTERGLEVHMLFRRENAPSDSRVFGAFKGIHSSVRTHSALLRWLWSYLRDDAQWPIPLSRKSAPKAYRIDWPHDVDRSRRCRMFLERFLNGDQPLPEIVLPEESPPLLVQTIWYEDTLRLRDFFERKTRLLRHLRAAFGLDETYVNQDQLDDFHVIEKSRSKPGAIKTS